MKTRTLPLLLSLAALSTSQSAWALTQADTTISNTATISYDVGGTAQTSIGSSPTGNSEGAGTATTFKVDRVIDLTVTKGSDVNVTPSGSAVTAKDITFDLANTGNDTETFNITLDPTLGSDDFDTSGCSIVSVSGAATTAALTVTMAKETTTTVTVNCDIPVSGPTVNNGKTSDLEFKATASTAATALGTADDPNAVETVYADADAAGTSDGAARNGAHAAINTYVIQTAALTVTKISEIVCDPYNDSTNPKRIPGAVVKYTITVNNSGASEANNVIITDPVPANMTYADSAPAGCTATVAASATATTGGTLAGTETGAATVISRTITLPSTTSATLTFFATVN